MVRKFPRVYWWAKTIASGPVCLLAKRHWSGGEYLPKEGGYLTAINHISEFDAVTFMHYMVAHGVPVRTMAKAELFKVPGLGWLMRQCGQIWVKRDRGSAASALEVAAKMLEDGECIGIYPEGTITRDPDAWPMEGKTGLARLALRTQKPVIPMVQWGAQDILDRYMRKPSLFPRKQVWVRALPEVDLSDLYDRQDDPKAWEEATHRIMNRIITALEEIRGVEMTTAIISRKDPQAPSKKMIARACRKWAIKNPKKLPSERPIGALNTFIDRYLAEEKIDLSEER